MCAVVAAGCSAGSGHPAASSSHPTTTPSATTDAADVRLVQHAVAVTAALRSYTYASTVTVAARRPVLTRITGRVVRGHGVTYLSVTRGRRTQVIRVGTRAYVRTVPGRWGQLVHPASVVDPTASLLAVLRGLTDLRLAGARTVHGSLPSAVASTARIPTDGRPADVSVTVDAGGHVLALDVSTSTSVGARSVTVTAVTSYATFDRAAAIKPPF